MASHKDIKTDSAPKKEPATKDKSPSDVVSTKPASSETSGAAASSKYSRGEGQKTVTQAYRDNWDAIHGKKTKTKAKSKR
jgi:hypothetical protein